MEKKNNDLRLFVDMDGTLAEFKQVDTLETLFEEGYFWNLKPQHTVIQAIRTIKINHPEIEVFILSSVLDDSKYALAEKIRWLQKYLPEIDSKHYLFPKCSEDKREFVEQRLGNISEKDFLLDDYSNNLHAWEPPARGIKLMNGINGNYGTWTKSKIYSSLPAYNLAEDLLSIMNETTYDLEINQEQKMSIDYQQNTIRKKGR